jgi:hypothetical protein
VAHLGSRQFLYWFAFLSELVCFLSGLRGFSVSLLSLTMDPKLKALLNPEDEVIWRQAGLFESVDNLQKESSGGAPFSKQKPSTLIVQLVKLLFFLHYSLPLSRLFLAPLRTAEPVSKRPVSLQGCLLPLSLLWEGSKNSLFKPIRLLSVESCGRQIRRLNAWF